MAHTSYVKDDSNYTSLTCKLLSPVADYAEVSRDELTRSFTSQMSRFNSNGVFGKYLATSPNMDQTIRLV